jgi:hypothetical protein
VAFSVIPEKAGIQLFQAVLDPGFRRGDDPKNFFETTNEAFLFFQTFHPLSQVNRSDNIS